MISLNKQEIIDYMEQAATLLLYNKQPQNDFQKKLNKEIIDYFNYQSDSGIGFNPEYVEVIKPKPFLIEEINATQLEEIYENIASKISKKFNLNLIKNPSNNYIPHENDYILVSYNYVKPNDEYTKPSMLELLKEATEQNNNLTSHFKNSVGGIILISNLENAPYMQRIFSTLISQEKNQKIIVGLGSEDKISHIENSFQRNLFSEIMIMHVKDLDNNLQKKLKI